MSKAQSKKTILKNRKASFEYYLEEKLEAGIVLRGSEVKSLRMGHGNLSEGYALIRNNEAWLHGFNIPILKQASYQNHSEQRERKLLLNAREIFKLDQATKQKGYTLVPTEIYFNDANIIKVEIALAKGKAHHDKRESEKKKDAAKEIASSLRR